jgi:hypothetical protein
METGKYPGLWRTTGWRGSLGSLLPQKILNTSVLALHPRDHSQWPLPIGTNNAVQSKVFGSAGSPPVTSQKGQLGAAVRGTEAFGKRQHKPRLLWSQSARGD